MITFKEYYMLQEAPVGYADTRTARQTNQQMMNPGPQGRTAGDTSVGQQPDAAIPRRPLPRLQNHAAMVAGDKDPVKTVKPAPNPQPHVPSEFQFGTEFDREMADLDYSDPEAVQDILTRMNQAYAANQQALDAEDQAARDMLPAPNQDKFGQRGAQIGKARNYIQSRQMR